jgi:hypothetical protein
MLGKVFALFTPISTFELAKHIKTYIMQWYYEAVEIPKAWLGRSPKLP